MVYYLALEKLTDENIPGALIAYGHMNVTALGHAQVHAYTVMLSSGMLDPYPTRVF